MRESFAVSLFGCYTASEPPVNRRSGDTPRGKAGKSVLGHPRTMAAVEFLAPGFVGPLIAEFALGAAVHAAPELGAGFLVQDTSGNLFGTASPVTASERKCW